MLDYVKAVLASKTMWGIILMAVPTIAKAFGHEISPDEAGGLVNSAQQTLNDMLTFGGMVLSFWGRTTAKGPLAAK